MAVVQCPSAVQLRRLAQSVGRGSGKGRLHTEEILHRRAFTHRSYYTEDFTQKSLYTGELLHRIAFTHKRAFTHRRKFYTEELLHRRAFTKRRAFTQRSFTVSARIIERKLRSTKVRLFTVPCCSIILFSSEGMKKNVSEFTPNFFRRSIILVGALLFYNSVFPHFSHISHFRSIINFLRSIIHFPSNGKINYRTEKLIIEL